MTKIALIGADGRMGQAIISVVKNMPALSLLPYRRNDDIEAVIHKADVVIDFSAPALLPSLLEACIKHSKPLVIGTTGYIPSDEAAIAQASQKIAILKSANMSIGVNILAALTEKAAALLQDDFDIEIFEAHHRHKKDAPSGTALLLGASAAKGRNKDLSAITAPTHREGTRTQGTIGFSVIRGGDIIGDHTVSFAGDGEVISLSHRATSRDLFAKGAVRAADWLLSKPAGFYTMRDLIAL